jgi:hypothetical protein
VSVYTTWYQAAYGEFALNVLGAEIDLQLTADSAWTDITTYALQREGTSPPITITRGRPDESATITPAACTMQWNNRDYRFTPGNPAGPYYPDLGRNTPVRVSVPDQTVYLRLEDDNTSGITCPDSSSLRPATGITVEVDMNLSNYQPCLLASKWGATGTAWAFYLNGDGTLGFAWYDGTSGHFGNSSTQPIPNLGRICVIVAFNATAGTIEFLTAPQAGGSQTQLGTTLTVSSTVISAATGQAIAAGGDDFAVTTGSGSLQGQVYEVRIYNASSVLVADPVFTSQTAGATSFADAQGNTWTVNGTCELSSRSYRGHFECSSLPVQWDPTGTDVWEPVAASGIMRRLQQGNSPILSALRRAISGLTDVVAWWPCEDLAGATQLASGLPGGPAMYFSGTPTLADDSNFTCSAAIPVAGTSVWNGAIPAYTPGASFTFGFLMDLSTEPPNAFVVFLSMNGAGSISEFIVGFATTGPILVWSLEPGGDGPSVTVPLAPVMVLCTATQSGSDVYMGISVIDAANGEIVSDTYTQTSASFGSVTSVQMNPGGGGGLSLGGLGHIFIQNGLTTAADLASPVTAWAGETAGNRFARLCTENNIAPRIYGFPDTTVIMGPQQIDTLANVLQSCEDADHGQIYEPRQCLGLGYRTLASMCNQPSPLTINYAAAETGDGRQGIGVTYDDQYTINDWTVTRNNGSSYQLQLNDGSAMSISPPPTGAGDYASTKTLYLNSDSQLPDAAGWLINVGTVSQPRYPLIPLNLARTELENLFYDIQDLNLGDYLAISSPPAWLPPGTIDQIVVGVTEQLGGFWWLISWQCVPELPYGVMTASDTTYGFADTDGSTLHANITSTATSMAITTTNSGSPLWTTSSGDFPFYVQMAGEVIEVTNITGASGTQTFTITRSVNGVVKAQTAGTTVSLYPTPIAALT